MEYTLKSGKILTYNYPGFQKAVELKRQIGLELMKVNVDISDLLSKSLDSQSINTFKNIILSIDTSKGVQDALFECLAVCTYGDTKETSLKITPQTFRDIEAVKDYYEILVTVVKETLFPFFESQLSELMPLIESAKNILRSLPETETQKQQ